MSLLRLFQPRATLSEKETTYALRMMTWEGMVSIGFTSITTSGFLAAFALVLGANNFQIGLLAAVPFILQPLQIPAVFLVEKTRRRKAIAVPARLLAQLLWFPIALIPLFAHVPGEAAISILIGLMAARGTLAAVTNCSWNGWVRDLVPQAILGRFFSRRLALSTGVAAAFGLAAALFVDYWRGHAGAGGVAYGYTYVLLFGALFLGLTDPILMTRIPEPLMLASGMPEQSLVQMIAAPFKDKNFRQLMRFLFMWSLALNLAVPFFAVYMLERVGLSLTVVIALGVLSQVANIVFLPVWGSLADRFSNKTVLSVCASLYLVVILGWTFVTTPDRYFLTMPLLNELNLFAGVAAAGTSLTVGTIGMKLAPEGQSTSYLAGASLATNIGAGIGPLIGGALAYFFAPRSLVFDVTWTAPNQILRLGVIHLTGFDFLFVITFIVGLVTLNMLVAVREKGESGRQAVLDQLMPRRRDLSRVVNSVPGLGFVSMLPFNYLRRIPGLDVAFGVTAYQIADAAKMIALGVAHGRRVTEDALASLESSFSQMWNNRNDVPEHATELALHATRGAVHVGDNDPQNADRVLSSAVAGILKTLSEARSDPEDAVRGIGRGAVEGAAETGIDLARATQETVAGVRSAARSLGLDQDRMSDILAEEMLRTSAAFGSDAEDAIKKTLSSELPEAGFLIEDARG